MRVHAYIDGFSAPDCDYRLLAERVAAELWRGAVVTGVSVYAGREEVRGRRHRLWCRGKGSKTPVALAVDLLTDRNSDVALIFSARSELAPVAGQVPAVFALWPGRRAWRSPFAGAAFYRVSTNLLRECASSGSRSGKAYRAVSG